MLTMVCAESDFDSSTGVCAHPVWMVVPDNGLLPPLSVSDAGAIAVAIVLVWAIAYGWRLIGRVLSI